MFVGYGMFKGKHVWIVRNSYGEHWGSQGHFYVPIGGNSYCIEQNAFVLLSKAHAGKELETGVFNKTL